MATDREATLKRGEKALRQGRLDAAIAEYAKVVEDHPKDWATHNTLGDLYVRAGQPEKAAAQYGRIADHFAQEGFFPKAAALYKKILKIRPDDETSQLRLADVSARQGLLADAKAHLSAVAERRRSRGDKAGANEIIVRLGSLDPADFDARRAAALVVAESGDLAGAAERFRALAVDLDEEDRAADALDAIRHVVRCDPTDRKSRARLVRAVLAAGSLDEAQQLLTPEIANGDAELREALAEVQLRSGRLDAGLALVRELLEGNPDIGPRIRQLAWDLCEKTPDAAFGCLDLITGQATAKEEWAEAAGLLQEFVTRAPRHVPALLKLVEVCVDGGLEATMYAAQTQLADAYLDAGQAREASVIAEDLVAREPWEEAHIDRFRRALVMLNTPNPNAVIADRLSGQSPFTATDPFVDEIATTLEATPTPPAPEPAPVEERAVEAAAAASGEAATPEAARDVAAKGPAPESAFEVTLGVIDLSALLEDSQAATEPSAPAAGGGARVASTGGAAKATPKAPPARGLDEVFQTLREEASADAGSGQGEQYLALARTYRDMGMMDDAIKALETAVRSPRHRFEAAGMLAAIYRERGQLLQAVEWMERAIEAPAPTADDGRALLYSLGETLESLGEVARALAVFLELQADVGTYRDVQARVNRLSRVQAGG